MVYQCETLQTEAIIQTIQAMTLAARTAPKARGIDEILTMAVDGEEKEQLAREMQEIGEEKQITSFVRDAKNVRSAQAVLLIGVRNKTRGVQNCGNCGYKDCTENQQNHGICALCIIDLGIALGSAVSIAADHRIDSRIMFTIGKAAISLGMMPEACMIYGIPVSVSGKNPFFDRQNQ